MRSQVAPNRFWSPWRLAAALPIGGLLIAALFNTKAATVKERPLDHRTVRFNPSRLIVDGERERPAQARDLTLHLVNDGDVPVRLLRITSSCGCTIVETPSEDTVNPRETTNLQARVTPPAVGEKTSYVEAFTDSPASPVVRAELLLRGEKPRVPYLTAAPKGMSLSCRQGEANSRALVMAAVESVNSPHWLRSVEVDGEGLEVIAEEVTQKPGPTADTCVRTYQYEIRGTPQNKPGRKFYRLAVRSGASIPVEFIPVSVEVRPVLEAVPSSLYVKVKSPARRPIERVINVRDDRPDDGHELQIQQPADDFLTVTAERLAGGGQFSMRLRLRIDGLPNGLAPNGGVRKTTLTLCGDTPGSERLVIPVVVEYR